MGSVKEKVAYLQGLTKGLNVSEQSAEGKLLLNVIDVLDSVAEELQCMHSAQQDLENYVETIDEDLTDLEEEFYETEEDDELVEVECPQCHEVVNFESDILEEDDVIEVTCPHCGEIVYDNTLEIDGVNDNEDAISIESRKVINPGL